MGAVVDKREIVAEAVVWLMQWLEQSDPDFKGASVIVVTTTNPTDNKTAIFDMASNESALNTFAMLLHGMDHTIKGNTREHIIPMGTKQ